MCTVVKFLVFNILKHTKSDRAERHCFWTTTLVILFLFFFSLNKRGKKKRRLNNKGRGRKTMPFCSITKSVQKGIGNRGSCSVFESHFSFADCVKCNSKNFSRSNHSKKNYNSLGIKE